LTIEYCGYPDFIPIDSFSDLLESEFCESRDLYASRYISINPSEELCDSLLAFLWEKRDCDERKISEWRRGDDKKRLEKERDESSLDG
jgi:hypothetical protein